jgi:hypothetical protein
MILKPETVGFVRGGMLFLEPPWRWRGWQRDVWTCCGAVHFSRLASSHAGVPSSPREGDSAAVHPRYTTYPQVHS